MGNAGKAWVFDDNIDTDILAPGLYMKGPIEQLAPHCLESVDPEFASNVQIGDVVVGGDNFGIGSSREQAAQVLKILGVRVLIAKSFAGIFYRNALNFGLFALTCRSAGRIRPGDQISFDAIAGTVENRTTDEIYECERLPEFLQEMVLSGGLVEHLEYQLNNQGKQQ